MDRHILRVLVVALICATPNDTTFAAPPAYPVLHQSDGLGIDDAPIEGWLDRIPDNSGNGNQLWSQSTPGVLDTTLSQQQNIVGPGPSGNFTRTSNGGTATMASTNDLQRFQFCWEADIQFGVNSYGAGQGGIGTAATTIFGSQGNQSGEGINLFANADGSLSAAHFGAGLISTPAGQAADDVWVKVAVCFENAYDGGLTTAADAVGAGRQIVGGLLKIYVNDVEQASGVATHVLYDNGIGPMLAQRTWTVGVAACLAFDNVEITGTNVLGPAPPATFTDVTGALVPSLPDSLTSWGDLNNDGFPELYASGSLWINNGGVSFTGPSAMIPLGGACVFGDRGYALDDTTPYILWWPCLSCLRNCLISLTSLTRD